MEPLIIREAVSGDGRQIVELLLRSWLATYAPLGVAESAIKESFGDLDKKSGVYDSYMHTRDTEHSVALVATLGERIVGMCFAHQVDGEWKLTQLYVEPAHVGQRIGSQLITTCLEQLTSDCTLSVVENNQRAIDFYQSHGFVATGERTRFALTKDVTLPEIILRRSGQ